jgi:hypothetical protein
MSTSKRRKKLDGGDICKCDTSVRQTADVMQYGYLGRAGSENMIGLTRNNTRQNATSPIFTEGALQGGSLLLHNLEIAQMFHLCMYWMQQ